MHRRLVRAGQAFAIVAIAIICLVAGFFGFANTGLGQRTIASLVEPLSGGKVSVSGLSGRFPDALRAAHIQVRDKAGVWLTIDNSAIDWSPLALLHSHVDIGRFEADRITMRRLPVNDEGSDTNFRVDIWSLHIGQIQTEAALSGKAMQLSAQGAVHYVSLRNVSSDLIVTRLDDAGTYRVKGSFTDGFIRGEAHVEEPAQGLIRGLLGLNEIGPIVLNAQASGVPTANVVEFSLDAGALHSSGQGTVDLRQSRADIDFTLNAPQMSLRPALSWQSVLVEGHLHGRLDAPDVDARVAIRKFRADDNAVEDIAARVQGNLGSVDFTATIAGLQMRGIGPKLLGRTAIDVKGHADLAAPTRPVSFTLSHPIIAIDGQVNLDGQRGGTARITLPEIAPFAALGGADLRGRAVLDAQVVFDNAISRIALDGTIDARGGRSLFAQLAGRNARIALKANIEGANIAISEARFDGVAISAQVSGAMRQSNLDLNGTIALSDVSLLAPRVSGAVRIEGRASGSFRLARLSAKATGDIATQGFAKQQITLAVDATGLPRPSGGNFRAEGSFDGGPVSLAGTFGWDNNDLKLAIERGEWKSLNAKASLTIPQSGSIGGEANLRLGRLQDVAPILGQPIQGSIEVDVALKGPNRRSVTLQARARNLRFQNIGVGEITVGGEVANPTDAAVLALNFMASRIDASGIRADASGKVEGPIGAPVLHVISDLRDMEGNPSKLTAVAILDTAKKWVLLRSFSGDYRQQTATLSAPATIDYAQGVSTDRLRAKIGSAEVSISGEFSPHLNASASVEKVTAEQLRPYAPQLSGGRFSGTAKLTGTLAAPAGNLTLTGRELRAVGTPAGIENASLDARAVLKDHIMSLDATITAGKSAHLTVKGDAPLDVKRNVNLRADGTLDLAIVDRLLSAEGRSLRGQLAVSASIGGTIAMPLVAGRAQLSDGDFQDFTRGLRIQDIGFTAESDGKAIRIADLSGRAGPGTIDGIARIDLVAPGLPVEMSLEAKNARPISNDRLTATMDAKLKLTGKIRERVSLSGTIILNRGEITLPDKLPSNVVVLDVRRRGQMPLEAMQSRTTPMDLDLSIATPGQFFVRGRGLDAELQGQIRVGGTDTAPGVTGGFNLRRGMYVLAGQTLNFTSGKVSFDGTGLRNKLDPTLDFAAQTVSGGVTATLQITGYASEPKVQLSSTPQLPQDEILARLLFRQSAKEMSPFQLAEIAQGAASLGGIGTSFNPLGAVRNRLGLDVLSLGSRSTAGGVAETTVEAGKYITQGVYVGARQSQSGGTQTQVQIDLTRNLKARATVDTGSNAATTQGAQQDSGNSVGLTYQFEY